MQLYNNIPILPFASLTGGCTTIECRMLILHLFNNILISDFKKN